jgi:N-acetylglucosaminyl-diphospho-decaprenol L-rhamnosyltransferase
VEAATLDVVIVTSDGARELLRHCLRSIERHPPRCGRWRVIVVDNASADGTPDIVRCEFPWVELVALSRNIGYSPANNLALRRTRSPFALLLNPDTELSEGALDHAIGSLSERPDAAVIGLRLMRRDGSFDHAAKRSFPTLLGALGHFTGVGRLPAATRRLAQYRAPDIDEFGCGEVDAVNGAFMLVRRQAFAEIGLLDEGYRMYGEDLDWCYRFKQAGWKVLYDGRATVIHVKGSLTVVEHHGRHRPLSTNLLFHRAIGRFYRKFHAGENKVLDAAAYAGLGLKLVISVTRSTVARHFLR